MTEEDDSNLYRPWCIYCEDALGKISNKTPDITESVLGGKYSAFSKKEDAVTVLTSWCSGLWQAHNQKYIENDQVESLRMSFKIINDVMLDEEYENAGCRYYVERCKLHMLPNAYDTVMIYR